MGISGSEFLFYGGIGVMAAAAVLALICTILFVIRGRKLGKLLKKEYGEPWKYNSHEGGGDEK